MAHEIGVRLATQLWGARYQVLVATHLDKSNHLHNHFVINTVSFIDGIKFHRTEKDYYAMQRASDALCREHELSVIRDPRRGRAKQYGEWKAEQEGRPTWRGTIKAEIDLAISQSMTESQFVMNLKRRGYEVKLGRDISVRPPGKERFFRLERNFGEEYSRQGIFRQMRAQGRPTFPEPEPKRRPASVARLNGNLRTVKKLTGFRALYFHYMYLMGKLPREHPRPPAKVHFLFREDLIQIDKISNEIKLLCRHRIDTSEQLFSYKSGVTERMETLTAERAGLRRQLRRLTDESDRAPVRTRIALLSAALGEARKEVALCDDIASRTAQIKAKIQAVRQEQQPQEKIRKREEVIR